MVNDPVMNALLTARSWGAACSVAVDHGLAVEGDYKSQHEAVYRVITSSGWALLVAPELWAVFVAHLAMAQIEGWIDDQEADIKHLRKAYRKPETLLLIEMESTKAKLGGDDQVYRTIKTGTDPGSVRLKALSDARGVLVKLQQSRAAAHKTLLERVQDYQDSLIAIADMPPAEQARAILRQQWTEQHKAGMRAQLSLAEQPRALIGCDPALLMGELEVARRQALARRDHAAVGVLGAEIRELTRATMGPAAMPDEEQDEADLARLEADRAAGRI